MDYKDKLISVEDALLKIKNGDAVFFATGASEPALCLEKLHTVADRLDNFWLTNCLPMRPAEIYDAKYADKVRISGWFYAPVLRKAHKNGNVSFVPSNLHFAAGKRLTHVKPNIFVCATSMPDKHGFVSLSTSNIFETRIMEASDMVIFEINPNMPNTQGDIQVNVNDVDYLIQADYKPPVMPETPYDEKDAAIGEIIADMVPDGACIQLGIGGIPNAVAASLKNKSDLGVHSEMLTTGIMKLAKMGVITGKYKTLNKGKMVSTFAVGEPELYEFMDNNPSVAILDGAWVNDPYVIAQNDNQVSINTTIEVDLTGQCASESIGPMQFSGSGGQVDTVRGAQMSKGGKSIIALHSTAMVKGPDGERREVSKISTFLTPGAAVSLQRQDVDLVVTEYGVASLKGTDLSERVDRLIAIAHPDFRTELRKEAIKAGIITR